MTLQERIRYIMKINGLTPARFADEISVQRSSVSHVLSGRNKPSLDFLLKIIKKYPNIDTHWLLTGERKELAKEGIDISGEDKTRGVAERGFTNVNNLNSHSDIHKIIIIYKNGTILEYTNA